ncbi:MAG: hypothetical protein EPO32_04595 [Anaerolineae bacterium]|nr:MAG: hypothetical protein EPO32_04595 [Anaerolineae bacterium]
MPDKPERNPLAFRPGREAAQQPPLARYLPRAPLGTVRDWLRESLPPGSWVIDPFGASPQVVVEAAQAGYRVLVAANNPINHFLIEMAAQPPSADALRSALAELANATRAGEDKERIEPHIRGLYMTTCDECSREIEARAFVWEKDGKTPISRIYQCPHCGKAGEFPATAEDGQKAARFTAAGPHRARALERVAPIDDPDREHAEEALDAYLPRAVYALFTLINKLGSLPLQVDAQRNLAALLLAACDRANTLWPVSGHSRPRQLGVPSRFREHNLWLALEEAIPLWATGEQPVPLTAWPEEPPESGGICLYDGALRNLADQLGTTVLSGVVTAFPRPNQAFWTLSALWAGWLWGREALGAFAAVLRRRRYDWGWHATALGEALGHLASHLPEDAPFFGLITESEQGFDLAAMLAAERSGFRLAGLAQRPGSGQTQILWRRGDTPIPTQTPGENPQLVRDAAMDILSQRGQPSHYLHLQAAAVSQLAENKTLLLAGMDPADHFNEIRSTLEFGLNFQRGFLRFEGSERSLEVGQWWPREPANTASPLADRLEKAIVQRLIAQPGESIERMDAALCTEFAGPLTPPVDTLRAILESYGEPDNEGRWTLKPGEAPKTRRTDLEEIRSILVQAGQSLGYQTEESELHVRWQDDSPVEDWHFRVAASAVLGESVLQPPQSERQFFVSPGSRARLLLHKLRRDPRLAQKAEKDGWRFLTFRLVRRMGQTRDLTRAGLARLLALDPLSEEATQLSLL